MVPYWGGASITVLQSFGAHSSWSVTDRDKVDNCSLSVSAFDSMNRCATIHQIRMFDEAQPWQRAIIQLS